MKTLFGSAPIYADCDVKMGGMAVVRCSQDCQWMERSINTNELHAKPKIVRVGKYTRDDTRSSRFEKDFA